MMLKPGQPFMKDATACWGRILQSRRIFWLIERVDPMPRFGSDVHCCGTHSMWSLIVRVVCSSQEEVGLRGSS